MRKLIESIPLTYRHYGYEKSDGTHLWQGETIFNKSNTSGGKLYIPEETFIVGNAILGIFESTIDQWT